MSWTLEWAFQRVYKLPINICSKKKMLTEITEIFIGIIKFSRIIKT